MAPSLKYLLLGMLYAWFMVAWSVVDVPPIVIDTKQARDTQNDLYHTVLQSDIEASSGSEKGAQSVADIITQHSALHVVDSSGTGARSVVHFRGFGDNAAQNTLVLINGQPLLHPDLSVSNINLLSAHHVGSIQISEHSQSVLYGDGAVGGVINIVTPTLSQSSRSMWLQYGTLGERGVGGTWSKPIDTHWSYSVNANHMQAKNYRVNNRDRQDHASASLGYHTAHTHGNILYNVLQQRVEFPGALDSEHVTESRRQAMHPGDYDLQTNHLLSGSVEHEWFPHWWASTSASALYGREYGILSVGDTPYRFFATRQSMFLRPTIHGVWNAGQYSVFPIFGIALKNATYRFDNTSYGSRDMQQQYAAFTQWRIPLRTRWSVILGTRKAFSYNRLRSTVANAEHTDAAWIYSAELRYAFYSHWMAYLRRAGNYRFPKVDEEVGTDTSKVLKPQTGVSYETGLQYRTPKHHLHAGVFQMDLHHEIAYTASPNPTGFGYNENLDHTRRQGVLLDDTYWFTPQWAWNVGYRWVRAAFLRGANRGKVVPGVPRQHVYIGNTYQWRTHWRFLWDVHYCGWEYPTNDMRNRYRQGGYMLLNAGAEYTFSHMSWSLRIDNINNKKYNGYTLIQSGTMLYYPAPGIRAMLTMELQL